MTQNPLIFFAMNLINRNPQVANNPMARQLIQVIQSGNETQGQQIAENLCQSYGISRDQALTDAKRFFGM
jgi:hypothetical protein